MNMRSHRVNKTTLKVTLHIENPALTESFIKQNINSNDVFIDLAPFMLSTQLHDIRMLVSYRE